MQGDSGSARGRALAFAVLVVVCAAGVIGYAWLTRRTTADATSAVAVTDPGEIARIAARPHLLVRHTAVDRAYGRLAVVPLDAPDGPRVVTSLSCERTYFAGGIGVCLAADRGIVTSYKLLLFDASYRAQMTTPLAGMPSRARVSADGSRAALTYFVSGDSYAAASFSTRTFLIDPQSETALVDLEDFAVTRDGARFKSVDFNFWGVTFAAEHDKFFATLSSAGTMYLVEGDARTRGARVLRAGVECPSLSPDNRRIAFKRRMPGIRLHWRLHVLDLISGVETPLAEERSVDDQVEWLDDRTILYALPAAQTSASSDVWAVPADGSGAPRILVTNADSPSVVRPRGEAEQAVPKQ